MAGGGYEEARLANDFLPHLSEMFRGQPFESEGQTLTKTLLLLRGWSCQSREDGRTPLDIIVAERDELLARREQALKGQ